MIFSDTAPFCIAHCAIQSARVACALERFDLGQTVYPNDLDALVPDYLNQVPLTPNTREPFLLYQREAKGRFVLRPVPDWDVTDLRHHQLLDTQLVWRYSPEEP
jgi:hypothetical protein